MGGYVTSGGLFALYMQNMFKTRTGGGGLEGVEALYHAYRDDVFRLALSYTGQIADAEDISQTVFRMSAQVTGLSLSPMVGFSTIFPKYECVPPNCTCSAPATAASLHAQLGLL